MGTDTGMRYASFSSLTKHRACPQLWFYAHLNRLEKVDPSDVAVERDMGSWWHTLRAAESIDRGRYHGSLKWTPSELSTTNDGPRILALESPGPLVPTVFAAADDWWRRQTPYVRDEWVARIGGGLPDRLNYVFERWQEMWAEEIVTERPLAVELKWERVLPDLPAESGGESVPTDTTLVGYVDEVYLDTRRQVVVARDHKIGKSLGTQSVADDMMDSQLQIYAWGANPDVVTWGLGPIRATAYDRARMVAPKTPVVTQAGSLSKSITDFDLHTYLRWCESKPEYPGRRKDGSDGGVYELEESQVARLTDPASLSAWFQRSIVPLNRNIVTTHLRAAVDSAIDIEATVRRSEVSGSAARNLTTGCRWCDMVGLCRAQMIGGAEGEYDLADYNLRKKQATGR